MPYNPVTLSRDLRIKARPSECIETVSNPLIPGPSYIYTSKPIKYLRNPKVKFRIWQVNPNTKITV
jgi:hypothetical protein